jgi:hypothetical protein
LNGVIKNEVSDVLSIMKPFFVVVSLLVLLALYGIWDRLKEKPSPAKDGNGPETQRLVNAIDNLRFALKREAALNRANAHWDKLRAEQFEIANQLDEAKKARRPEEIAILERRKATNESEQEKVLVDWKAIPLDVDGGKPAIRPSEK